MKSITHLSCFGAREAKVSKILKEQLYYLMSRGLSESEATEMIVMEL